MSRRMKAGITALLAGGALVGATAGPASSAPITCPSGQTVTKTSDGWACVNNGDNSTGAGFHQGNGNKIH